MPDDPLQKVHDALEDAGCWPRGDLWQFTAQCPAHEDRSPSLSVSEGADRRVLLHCHAGCDVQAIVGRLGLVMSDLFPSGHKKGPRKPRIVRNAPAPGEALLRALTLIGNPWSGMVVSTCPCCGHASTVWHVGALGVTADCPEGCGHDEVIRALDNSVAFATVTS